MWFLLQSLGLVNLGINLQKKFLYLCRYLEPFNKMVPIYHPFERGVAEKVILAFANDLEAQKAAKDAGAARVSITSK